MRCAFWLGGMHCAGGLGRFRYQAEKPWQWAQVGAVGRQIGIGPVVDGNCQGGGFVQCQQSRAALLAATASRISVVGYADDSLGPAGSQALNRAVSQARATAVARYLQARGLMPSRISIIGRGAADPVGDNRTEAGRALNRRVEIVVDRAS